MTPPVSGGYRAPEDADAYNDFAGIHRVRNLHHPENPPLSRPMIEVHSLAKIYGEFTAVRDLSFTVQPGEVTGLVGPNGAGKTTTLRCCSGVIPPTRGTVRIRGIDLATDPVGAKRQLAFFPDEPRLFEYLTVRQHLGFIARLYGVADYEARAQPPWTSWKCRTSRICCPGNCRAA